VLDAGLLFVTSEQRLGFISPRGRELLGCPPDASLEACWRHVAPLVQRALASGRPLPGDAARRYTPTSGDAPRVHLDVYDVGGEAPAGHLLMVRERRGLDDLRSAMQRAVRPRGVEQAYQILAHDARHPITAALMHLSMLQEYDYEQFTARGPRALALIERQLRETNAVITLLVEALVPDDEREPIDLRTVATDVLHVARPTAQRLGVTLDVDLAGVHVWCRGHRHDLTQAVLGLVAYALEPDPGPETTARDGAHRVTLRLALEGEQAHFVVAHGAPGLSSTHRQDVLASLGGEGLPPAAAPGPLPALPADLDAALVVQAARRAADLHGGTLTIESTLTTGTTFRLALPYDETSPRDTEDAEGLSLEGEA
jgi:signal transduction histidine kinase